jgi:hypothetical protein
LEGFGIENVVIFYDPLEYFSAIWYSLQPFDKVCGHLVYFSVFGMFGPRKIWQPRRQRTAFGFDWALFIYPATLICLIDRFIRTKMQSTGFRGGGGGEKNFLTSGFRIRGQIL